MKRQIRSSVFETNSSSMHSLVILKENNTDNERSFADSMWLSDDGIFKIWREDDLNFGRYPFRCLTTFRDKLCYAIASLCGWRDNRKEILEEIKDVAREVVPEFKDIELPKYYWSWEDDSENDLCYGSVDEDILTGFLEQNNITLKEFLTNSKYIVIVDGDEYCIYKDMKKCGIINENNIEKEYPDYYNY